MEPGSDGTTSDDVDPSQWGTPEGKRMIELLWDPPAPPSRGPKQRLTLDQVVDAAMRIAGTDGADALSMRKVAAELGVGAMSLYTYVPGRDELFELMVDRAWADRALPDPSLPWREQVEVHAQQAWAMYAKHPWLVYSNLWRMPLGPRVLDAQEDLYRALLLTGLPPDTVVRLAGLVEAHVFGTARGLVVDTRQAASTGVTVDDYWESRGSFWGTYYSAERFPTMTHLWEAGAFEQPPGAGDLEVGLDLLLDGIELLVARHAPPGAGSMPS